MDFSILRLSMAVLFIIFSTQMGICYSDIFPSQNFISWRDLSMDKYLGKLNLNNKAQGRVIVVAKDGTGDSRTVQGAVDLVPDGNKERVKIFILPGIYREKVIIPATKPYISLIGNQSYETVISWNSKASDRSSDGKIIGTFASASIAVDSDYFCARGITFENTAPRALPGANGMQAVALRVSGDKAMFYSCRILGSQDTLFDHIGRHYFFKCYIQGSIDFIFGKARSLYQDCTLHAIADSYGAVAASQRNSASENSGFSFINCDLTGSGIIYLGRAWGKYARVVYSFCDLEGIIIPQGWSDWGDPSRRGTVLFGEFKCKGRGASSPGRVPWAKSLTYEEARPFLDKKFIDGDQWLRL
ncbi:pectinesterase QRT1 [Magnolia sinica]|uniref:pectinesterase QRT1 n=1 Tax=Magnolia sinica TaxID=86752 RepID=UPI0026595675|nr:pectinesterase QRT1 [Magnolia sinica]